MISAGCIRPAIVEVICNSLRQIPLHLICLARSLSPGFRRLTLYQRRTCTSTGWRWHRRSWCSGTPGSVNKRYRNAVASLSHPLDMHWKNEAISKVCCCALKSGIYRADIAESSRGSWSLRAVRPCAFCLMHLQSSDLPSLSLPSMAVRWAAVANVLATGYRLATPDFCAIGLPGKLGIMPEAGDSVHLPRPSSAPISARN